MVRYWEEFGTIAFDPSHDTLLTACSLKNPSDSSDHPIVKCCFSFSIRRDEHKLYVSVTLSFFFTYANLVQGLPLLWETSCRTIRLRQSNHHSFLYNYRFCLFVWIRSWGGRFWWISVFSASIRETKLGLDCYVFCKLM